VLKKAVAEEREQREILEKEVERLKARNDELDSLLKDKEAKYYELYQENTL